MRQLLFTVFVVSLIFSCNNAGKKEKEPIKKDTTIVSPPPKDTISHKPGTDTTGKPGEMRTMKMTFSNYDEGDYAHTIFKETSTGQEWDFGHPDENKLNGIDVVLKDDKSGWGYKTNKKMISKAFIVQVIYKTLDGMDLDGKPIKYNDWRITDLKEDK
jgi:hypothetical protein